MKKLAIVSTHPIQYYAPVFQRLANEIQLKVFYTEGKNRNHKFDHGFKRSVAWDIPLLDGYDHEFLENIAKDPGTHHFKGIINPSAIQRINNYQPDIILVYGWGWSSHLNIIRKFHKNKIVCFRGDSTLLDNRISLKNLLRRIFLTWVYKHVDVAFYVGQANKAYFESNGLKENQLIWAPHSIDNNRFSAQLNNKAIEIRTELGIKEDEILILFAGKLEEKKNPMLLLNAFAKLNQPSTHLLFVGNGNLEQQLKEEGQKLKLEKLHFLDFQNQSIMPSIYQATDIFCLPSKGPGETWGLAVNEAMAAGKSILVSDKVGCAIDLVTPEVGYIFRSEDLNDLEQKLIALTKTKAKLKQMGKSAFEQIQNWSFEVQVNTIANYVNG
jgi:glycosyltransferase involved in cell wall biosynthesis